MLLDDPARKLTNSVRDFKQGRVFKETGFLLSYLFWHPPTKTILKNVDPEIVTFMLLKAGSETDRAVAVAESRKLLEQWKGAELITWGKAADPLNGSLVLTPHGEKYIQENNLPPRPWEVFWRDMAEHKVAIIATVIGIVSGAIGVYEFVRRVFFDVTG